MSTGSCNYELQFTSPLAVQFHICHICPMFVDIFSNGLGYWVEEGRQEKEQVEGIKANN